ESIPIYKEEDIVRYYEEIEGIIDILYNNFKEGTINNNKGQIITDNLEEIYKIDEQNKIKIRFIRKEENSDYILEVEL
ncbi:hypothetical protein, partial [Clostridium sp.]|uniref:hypothetical protein n=1 Tax=Clostridium sp. TaxID=1506 RepID=UPI002615CD15